MTAADVKPGDGIRLNATARDWTRSRLFTIDEVKSWGVRCYTVPDKPIQGVVTLIDDDRVFYMAPWSQIAK